MSLCCDMRADEALLKYFGLQPMMKAFEEIESTDPTTLMGFLQIENLTTRKMQRVSAKARQTATRETLQMLRVLDADLLSEADYSQLERGVGNIVQKYGISVSGDITPVLKEAGLKTARRTRTVLQDALYKNPDDAPVFRVKDRKAINRVLDNNKVFIERQYNKNLSSKISSIIAKDFEETGGSVNTTVNRMIKQLPDYFTEHDRVYLGTVATVQLNNARTYSQLRTFQDADIKKFEIVSVMDGRTTPICRHLDGMTFSVDDAIAGFNKMSRARTYKGLIKAKPFIRHVGKGENLKFVFQGHAEEYDPNDVTEELLSQFGSVYPPYHHRCRTTIVMAVID